MRRHWQYLKYVLRHKWFVFLAGIGLGVPIWRLIIHDWDKFLPSMWFAYARFFYNADGSLKQKRDKTGYYKPKDTGSVAFDHAVAWHCNRNDHHWQYWVSGDEVTLIEGRDPEVKPMNEVSIREMIADWKGAGRAQGTPDTVAWYRANRDKMILHPETRFKVEVRLGTAGELITGVDRE